MNLASVIALIVIIVLLVVAIRYIRKNGTCGACPDAAVCSGHCHRNPKDDPDYEEKCKKIDQIMEKHGI